MAIKFLCPHCKRVVSVKDEFAGKRGKCPYCQKILTVPVPTAPSSSAAVKPAKAPPVPIPPKQAVQTTAPPPGPIDAEAEAAAALADEPKPEDAAAPTTIDFTCPMCDAPLHLPLVEAGKRLPCPECRRIIKVPEPEKRDPANWRQKGPNLPSGAKREVEAAPEGAWGSAAAAAVSREALQEAGAVPQKKEPVPLSRRIVRYSLWSAGAVAILLLLVFGYLKWRDSRAEQGAETALAYADSDAGKKELGAAGRSALYRLAGEYVLRAGRPDSGKRARALFEKGLQAATEAPVGTERDALLQDLARAEVELGGKPEDVDAGRKVAWEDVQKDLRATLGDMRAPEPKVEALRTVARRLAEQDEGARATALAHSLFSSANEEKAEALGVVGLELFSAEKKEQADTVWNQLKPLYAAKGKDRPALAPAAVALAVVLEQPPPEPAKKSDADAANALVGQVEGLARQKKWDDARAKSSALQGEALVRAKVALAAADLDDPKAGNADVTDAFSAAQSPQAGQPSPWLLLRLARIGGSEKIAPDSIQAVAAKIADPALRGRAQLAVLQARLADPKQAGDPKLMDAVEPKTVAAWMARTAWARRNPGAAGVVKGWDGPNRAFGLIGLALGEQGRDESFEAGDPGRTYS